MEASWYQHPYYYIYSPGNMVPYPYESQQDYSANYSPPYLFPVEQHSSFYPEQESGFYPEQEPGVYQEQTDENFGYSSQDYAAQSEEGPVDKACQTDFLYIPAESIMALLLPSALPEVSETLTDMLKSMKLNPEPLVNSSSEPKASKSVVETNNNDLCKFCRSNGETAIVYKSHSLKDKEGLVICPMLSKYVCELCGKTGSEAHTIKYCEMNRRPSSDSGSRMYKKVRNTTGSYRVLKY